MNKTGKVLLIISVCINFVLIAILLYPKWVGEKTFDEYFSFGSYKDENMPLKKTGAAKVIFIGNSITRNWMNTDPEFFTSNGYTCRGIGGQTSSQLLLRFYQDVVELSPQIVIVNAGTNDIAMGDGFYDAQFTLNNIKAMVDIATHNGIKVVLTSVLPAKEYKTSRLNTVKDVTSDIDELNTEIEKYAQERNLYFIKYNNFLSDEKGYFNKNLTFDGVHPNAEGYKVMEGLIKPIIDSILAE